MVLWFYMFVVCDFQVVFTVISVWLEFPALGCSACRCVQG